ncbi:hypothetical protein [Kribbella sp. CCNWLY201]
MAAMQLTVAIAGGADSDAEEVERLTAQLRRRLLDLEVATVEPVLTDDIPSGAKPADAVTLGTLAVTLVPAVLQAAQLVEAWSRRHPLRSVKLTLGSDSIDLIRASSDDQQRLVEHLTSRHTAG